MQQQIADRVYAEPGEQLGAQGADAFEGQDAIVEWIGLRHDRLTVHLTQRWIGRRNYTGAPARGICLTADRAAILLHTYP